MDKLRKARGPARTAVTKACNEIDVELAKTPMDAIVVKSLVERLEKHGHTLEDHDMKYLEKMLESGFSDEDIQKEQDESEEYQMRVSVTKNKATISVNKPHADPPTDKNKKSYKLPKTEIKKFNGEVTDWLGWWAQFQKIHADVDIDDSDKFQYLSQAMVVGSKAAEVVRVYPQTAANYPKVIKTLQDRFGKEKVLKRVYVRELLKLIIKNSREKLKMSATFDQLDAHLKALESLGITPDQMDVLLYPMVESCVPEEILMAWQRSPNFGKEDKGSEPPKTEFDFLMEFIKQEVENEGQRKIAKEGFGAGNKEIKIKQINDMPTAATLVNVGCGGCIFCDKNHKSQNCFKAKKMPLDDRSKSLQSKGACYRCLVIGHIGRNCKESIVCSNCSGKNHYAIMCRAKVDGKPATNEQVVQAPEAVQNMAANQVVTRMPVVLMKTLQVCARGPTGKEINVRLLFDEGSSRSYIKSALANKLNCVALENFVIQNHLFGGQVTENNSHTRYQVTIQGINSKESRDLKLINQDVICSFCPSVPKGPWIEELKKQKIFLSDTWTDAPEVEILIGSDVWGKLMTGRMFKLRSGLIAVESIFGWTLSGELPNQNSGSCAMSMIAMLTTENEYSLKEMWSLETLGIRDSAEKISQEEHDLRVKKGLQENMSREADGRYVVRLPWIDQSVKLPENRMVAEKRLVSATEKLKKIGEFEAYDKIFREWEKEGLIDSIRATPSKEHFLPHRPVFKPESLTTPIRPVFDASCKVGKNPSLNQCLEKGPNLLELIPSILHRFREKKIGVIADIRKAFQMVGVADDDKNFQKFLWWEDEDKKILKEYRHCRVVFGLNCSPFILAAVLDLHLSQVTQEDKPVAELLKKSLYVDNVVTSLDDEGQLKKFKEKSVAILREAKMDLRQWESNFEDSHEGCSTTVLGLDWQKDTDTLSCRVQDCSMEDLKVSKRKVLSVISKVFDPIGFTCPTVLRPKLLLQDAWIMDKDWDKEWTGGESQKFLNWMEELTILNKVNIPRNAFGGFSRGKVQLHHFCDASQNAYAAAVFIRVELGEEVSVQLLQAKSRLAPLDKKGKKGLTIPRLELMGCLIGSRLTQSVKESLSLEEDVPTFHWSDSTTAIAWIKRDEDWGTFVGNRSREINRLTKAEDWRYVPGPLNPADLPSRGCSPSQLLESKWWEGPGWLKESQEKWPTTTMPINEDEVSCEVKKTVARPGEMVMMSTEAVVEPRFSSYLKNVGVAAWIRRFIENCKKKKEDRLKQSYLTVDEMRKAELDLIREVQSRHYPEIPVMKTLQMILEADGLIHVKTRIVSREDTVLFRSPILLPSKDPIVKQFVEYVHRSNCHAGAQFVLGKIRERFWIVHGRKTVTNIIRKCVVCKRHNAKSQPCDPAPLPQRRIQTQFAFQTTGVDLAGPLMLKGGKKAWIVIYTCAVYRGVYLDIVNTISTAEFLDSLEKFTLLVGRPNTIYSDNGTNFVGAQSLLKRMDPEKFRAKGINWIFNPPAGPWWGGWWERLIRTLKELLRKMIGTAKLTQKELEMCLASLSYTINNRPLTTLTEDCDDLDPLTPAMFMKDLPVGGLPGLEEIQAENLTAAYNKVRGLRKALDNRFRKEYLAQLVQKSKETGVAPLQIGDVVLIGSENKKRYEWPLAKVIELFPGKDEKIRVAKVKTANGILLRPVQRLFPLEVTSPKSLDQLGGTVKEAVLRKSREKRMKSKQPETTEVSRPLQTRSGRIIRAPFRYDSWNK